LRNLGLILILAASLVLAYAMLPVFRPSSESSRPITDMPWQITPTADGSITVFGLTLGESTLADAVSKLGHRYDLGLFREADGRVSLEAYFKDALLGGMNARLVLALTVAPEPAAAMLSRSGNGKSRDGGVEQFSVAEADVPAALATPIESLTYVPFFKVPRDLALERFGNPAERLVTGDESTHWLYPNRGLDLVLGPDGQAILQYTPPRDFDRLREPLYAPAANGDAS
jgi:hypothetical protein